ncbi:hypothetical protein LEP1GSC199_3471 [Leptospira vanthielii serovar Holland str. Waz Holland = ATCC 700522]|uniref:Uncharacterized protein n=2 Tax=Leptospira vanthielii TaxID=293085 RepID=N1W4R4_9LEPT|nr:hypothetical protein LEP1GSC199_3471 [Leptospira vanthielii serovar Holland str. Waz Holland = ATCC 700522]
MRYLVIISILFFATNCVSSFYSYSIHKNQMDFSSPDNKSPLKKKNILFITDGYLEDLADMLEKRGHTVDRVKIAKENLAMKDKYDTVIILKSDRLDVLNEAYLELPMIFSLGIIPSYAKFDRNYEFIVIQNNTSTEVKYSLTLKKYTGWIMYYSSSDENAILLT